MRKMMMLGLMVLVAVSAFGRSREIASGLKLYIEPNAGFEVFLTAAIEKKHVPVVVTLDRAKADWIVTSTTEHGKEPSWAQTWVLKKRQRSEDASIYIIEAKTKTVLWAYAVHKYSAKNGEQSTAEAVAKHLKERITK